MFLEACGKLFSSQIRPVFFFFLLLLPLGAAIFFGFSRISHLHDLENQFALLRGKAKGAYARKERKEHFLARYSGADPFYLDHQIEAHRFLQSEIDSLKLLSKHPAIANPAPLLERAQFLSGENNRIAFTEMAIRTSPHVKETEEKQRFPIQMDEKDLKKLLSLIEDLPIDSLQPEGSRPQFLIRDFRLQKKQTPLQTEVFEVEMELLKREFFS